MDPVLRRQWAWTILCCALVLWGILWGIAPPSAAAPLRPDETRLLTAADFIISSQQTPPALAGTQVALPDNWRLRVPALGGFAWYRMRFQLAELPQEPLALYLPHLSVAGEVWLNGSLLNPGVRFGSPGGGRGRERIAPMNDKPLYLVLPAGLFHIGDNQLAVLLRGDPALRSGLSAIRLGPALPLQQQWFKRYLVQEITPYIILVLIAGSLCFLVAYTWRQRRLFIIQFALLISLAACLSYMANLAISLGAQEALRVLITTTMYWALCVAGYRLSGARLPWFPPLLHGLTLATLATTLIVMGLGMATDRIWLFTWPHVLLRLVPIALLLRLGWRQRSLKYSALALTALLWTITVAQSYLIIMEALPWDSFRWSFAGALPFCIVLIYFFAERFIIDREVSQLEKRAAIVAERSRILQDMHDGMGAQLITALRLARRAGADPAELARHIEESLQDLRLIIDSLDLTEQDLLPLLGNLRFRLEPRLRALGIELVWDVAPIPPLPYLTPESALSILRIVQEAINNALQHAQPSRILIAVKPAGEEVVIRVADDGSGGIPLDVRPGSRGLAGMHNRASKLGVALTVRDSAQGTEVMLQLPRRM
ncbi:sensor histidine kinase [Sodalis sp. RH21]|uniref:sensor histidine kinase n=1 Tax=unclassified Sodalis (in: enterobacteria) TaxID=2636512 RepID=UPI0039B58E3E